MMDRRTNPVPSPDPTPASEWEVTPGEVCRLLEEPGAVLLLDCRTAEELEIGQVAGNKHIPLHELGTRLDELDAYRGQPIVVYCHHGQRSLMATQTLRQAGFGNVRSMAGGIHRWSLEVDQSVPTY